MREFGPRDFVGQQLQDSGRWALLFMATWCPFCRAFGPLFERLDGSTDFQVGRVDLTDLENPLWERFDVDVIPSVLVFDAGALVGRVDGVSGVGLGESDVARVRELASGPAARTEA